MTGNAYDNWHPGSRTLPSGKTVFINVLSPSTGTPKGSILFIHALGGSSNQYIPIIRESGIASTHRLILWDFEGHGLTSLFKNEHPALGDYVSTAKEVLDTVGVPTPVTVVGHSMAGLLSTTFAAKYPSVVSKLLVYAPVTAIPPNVAPGLQGLADSVRSGGMISVADTLSSSELSKYTLEHRPLSVGFHQGLLLGTSAEGYARAAVALAGTSLTPNEPNYAAITAKTLIVSGKDDPVSTAETAKFLVAHIKGSSAVAIINSAHWPLIEDVTDSAAALRSFLSS